MPFLVFPQGFERPPSFIQPTQSTASEENKPKLHARNSFYSRLNLLSWVIRSATVLFPEKLELSKNTKQHISFAYGGGAFRVYFNFKELLD